MSLSPDGFKVNAGFLAVSSCRKGQIDFRAQGSIALIDAGADAPICRGFAGLISCIGGGQIIHRIVHIHTDIHGVAQGILPGKIREERFLVFTPGYQFCQNRVKVRSIV